MSSSDQFDRLEQRVARLEQLMRQLLHALPAKGEGVPSSPPAPPAPTTTPPLVEAPASPPAARPEPVREPSFAMPVSRLDQPIDLKGLDSEQWVGQKGLLAVGVAAVILAAGYLIKLSFERGWVSPATRCITGALSGLAVSALGWWITRRGYRTYGTALVGTGAAIVYLVVWAASRLYGFLDPTTGIVLMALVAFFLAGEAWLLDAEPLGAAATLGAFFAPVVIGNVAADANRLLAYLGIIGLALGAVAWSKRWRLTTLLIALSYFGLGTPTADNAGKFAALLFGAAGGGAGLALGLKYDWWETRFLSFWGGWICLTYASAPETSWLVLVAGLAMSYPVWEHALARDGTWPYRTEGEHRSLLQSIYFYITPIWLVWAVENLGYQAFRAQQGLGTAIVAALYLLPALLGDRRPFAVVANLGAVIAVILQWQGEVTTPGVLGVLALAWGTVARVTRRQDWNLHALLPLGMALLALWTGGFAHRPQDAPAFFDRWALMWWGLIIVCLALANDLAAPEEPTSARRNVLLATAGGVLWLGMTGELLRHFRLTIDDPAAARLTGGLAVSIWWVLFAGNLILWGFRKGARGARIAGLWVAGIAVLKVIFVDLSELDALYRIGSVFGLGFVSLLVAWLYHRRARLDAASHS